MARGPVGTGKVTVTGADDGAARAWAGWTMIAMKADAIAIFDGVISAFQAHTDTAVFPGVVAGSRECFTPTVKRSRSTCLSNAGLCSARCRDSCRHTAGVKWDPADHLCVAGVACRGSGWSALDHERSTDRGHSLIGMSSS